MQESLLTIRKERIGCKELDMTKRLSTQRRNRNNTSRERQATPREANSLGEGCRVFKVGSFA